MQFKSIGAAVLLSVAGLGASATTTNLGAAAVGVPLAFGAYAPAGSFSDFFTFSLPANGGSGYSVSNFTALPAQFNTVLSTLSLLSNPDGILFNGDDSLVASSGVPGGGSISLAVAASPAGDYYINVTGLANGSSGGVYNGAISVSAVPEPASSALMLAGLGVMGIVASRRRWQR